MRRAAGRATPTWSGCAPGGSTARRTPSSLPGERGRGRRACSRSAPREGVAVVPFGGGTSVVGGVEPLRGGFERLICAGPGRLREVEVDRRSLTATARPRPAGPRGRGGAGGARGDAGPLPAVVRVRDDRRLRRDALGGPGVERLRALRRARHLVAADRAGGRDADARDAPHGGGAGAARAGRRLRGRARRDHRGRPCGCGRSPSSAATRRGWRPTSQPAPRSSARWPRPMRCRTWCGVSDEAETRISLALSRARRAPSERSGRLPAARGAARRMRRDLRLGRRARGGRAPARPGDAPASRRGRGEPRQAPRAELGSGGATTARICVTSCSTSGTWPRPWRPRTRGAGSASLYDGGQRRDRAPRSSPGDARGRHVPPLARLSATAPRSTSPSWLVEGRAPSSSSGEPSRRPPARRSTGRGGTITHHHGVGRDHLPYMSAEIGELGIETLRAVKDRLDPAGIMNPGKLITAS